MNYEGVAQSREMSNGEGEQMPRTPKFILTSHLINCSSPDLLGISPRQTGKLGTFPPVIWTKCIHD